MGPKEFVPMLVKCSYRHTATDLDKLYPKKEKADPKAKKVIKKSQTLIKKTYPTLLEEKKLAVAIQSR